MNSPKVKYRLGYRLASQQIHDPNKCGWIYYEGGKFLIPDRSDRVGSRREMFFYFRILP
jgi:hypothetical protein